jgi:hypothetical protein
MRINLVCPECAQATGGVGTWFVDTIRDDGFYDWKCPNSHDLFIGLQTLRHEMLFEIALNAMVDHYYREAVSSFAASMERYFEFAIRVISQKHGVQGTVFDEGWKRVSSRSERQIGAYIFLHMVEFGNPPRLLSNKLTEFRNDVIHNGLLPQKKETIAFGEAVYEVIQEGIRHLRETHRDFVERVLGEHVARVTEKMGSRYPRTFQVTSTALNVIDDTSGGYMPFGQLLGDRGISL